MLLGAHPLHCNDVVSELGLQAREPNAVVPVEVLDPATETMYPLPSCARHKELFWEKRYSLFADAEREWGESRDESCAGCVLTRALPCPTNTNVLLLFILFFPGVFLMRLGFRAAVQNPLNQPTCKPPI